MRFGGRAVAMMLLASAAMLPAATQAWAASPPSAAPSPKDLADNVPHSLYDALAMAYSSNPQLTAERAKLRATDENVPQALAGWRPTVSISAQDGNSTNYNFNLANTGTIPGTGVCGQYQTVKGKRVCEYYSVSPTTFDYGTSNIPSHVLGATVTQYLYRGGKTVATTHEAEDSVRAERANLIAQEEQVLNDTVNAYVGVVQNFKLVEIDRSYRDVLAGQLKAINARFKVGELTTTDVAQAEAALAQAISQYETAIGNLQSARATFAREVGVNPPEQLPEPPPLGTKWSSAEAAADLAVQNNPNVIAALFSEAQAKDAVDVAFAALAPTVSLQGQAAKTRETVGGVSVGGGANTFDQESLQGIIQLNIPIYQGGAEYATIRQARQSYQQAIRTRMDDERQARQQAVQAYETLTAARAALGSSRIAVKAGEIALEGVEREALVGTASTSDVLVQEQNLLTAQITEVQNVTDLTNATYGLAAAVGRLTARDLALNVPLYDETAYYNAVHHKLWGTYDEATSQPGR